MRFQSPVIIANIRQSSTFLFEQNYEKSNNGCIKNPWLSLLDGEGLAIKITPGLEPISKLRQAVEILFKV